jgi:hypothetical protein
MRTRLLPTSLLTLSLALAGTTAVTAQDATQLEPEVAYATGTLDGDLAGSVPPQEEFPAEGLREMRGWSLVGIPIKLDDPRVSGQLTFVANGSGQEFQNGGANIERRTYRLENEDGAWTGSGNAVSAGNEDGPLMDLETAILIGEGDYEGLTAFLYSEGSEQGRDFRAVVVAVDAPPTPDPVSPTAVEDIASAN